MKAAFTSQEIPWYSFLFEAESTRVQSATRRIMSMKNSNDIIGNRSRDIPVCSAVPQLTAPPHAPNVVSSCFYLREIFDHVIACYKMLIKYPAVTFQLLTVLKDSLSFSFVQKTWDILNIFPSIPFFLIMCMDVLKFQARILFSTKPFHFYASL